MKILIWGTGKGSKNATNYILTHKEMHDTEIIVYVDNNSEMWETLFFDKKVVSPAEICKYEFDYVVIASVKYEIIKQQCIEDIGIPENKIITATELYWKGYARYQYIQRYQGEKDYEPVIAIDKDEKWFDKAMKMNIAKLIISDICAICFKEGKI